MREAVVLFVGTKEIKMTHAPQDINALSDKDLLEHMAGHGEFAFRAFYDRYRGRIFGIALAMMRDEVLAEDVLQEIFAGIWAKRNTLTAIEHVRAWVNTITRNHIYNALRRQALGELVDEKFGVTKSIESNTAPDKLAHEELQLALRAAMENLTQQQRKVFELSTLKSLSIEEIMAELSLSKETVKKHLGDARRIVRAELHLHDPKIQAGIVLLLLTMQ